jgi:P-type conjugative transfer protein TrbJ
MHSTSKVLVRSTGLFLVATLLIAPITSRGFTIFGTGGEGEQIVAAISMCQLAVTALQTATNSALNTMRHGVSGGDFAKAIEMQQQNLATLNAIQADLQRIGFTSNTVQQQYNRTFFATADGYKNLGVGDLRSLDQAWAQKTHDSVRAALGALARLGDVRANNAETSRVVEQSRDSGGQVAAQIQASNQLLANLSTQISQLTEALVAQGRVSGEAVATATAEKQRDQELGRRRMQDFNKKDRYSLTYTKLP